MPTELTSSTISKLSYKTFEFNKWAWFSCLIFAFVLLQPTKSLAVQQVASSNFVGKLEKKKTLSLSWPVKVKNSVMSTCEKVKKRVISHHKKISRDIYFLRAGLIMGALSLLTFFIAYLGIQSGTTKDGIFSLFFLLLIGIVFLLLSLALFITASVVNTTKGAKD